MRAAGAVLSAALVLALPAAAAAFDWAIGVEGGYQDLTSATNSAKALFGSSGGPTFGGMLRIGLGSSWFVAGGAHYFTRDGERVFVPPDKSGVFKLGHPLHLKIVPVYGLIGYRFTPDSRLVPYLALGAGATAHREDSTIAGLTEFDSRTRPSAHFVGGVEYGGGALRLGAELMYSLAPDSLGLGGVSKIYGEKDIGGLSAVGRLVFTPGH